MKREDILKEEVKDYRVLEIKNVSEISKKMLESGGFTAKSFGKAVDILTDMFKSDCIKFLSFPGCIVSTGLRGVIAELIENGFVDVIITTCGTLDHDLARAWGGKYWHGSFEYDDASLKDIEINRLGNILVPNESYGIIIEEKMKEILTKIFKEKNIWSGFELIQKIGETLNDKNSILYQCAKRKIPIFVPGITDGAFGTNLVWFSQENDFKLDLLEDEKELAKISFTKKKTGALMIGGGISKHHTIWWNQFKGGLDFAVYITTATQYDGSLSGARLEEAISWGKISKNAKYTTIDGDATLILPFLLKAVYERIL
ncbi:MAG: deoxyhypusine synthase [Candidatus Aenigmatarchaeota archaeon]|nr:deoxyhypusine synthase [Candidatus Aenigmarchaeota archaeon]